MVADPANLSAKPPAAEKVRKPRQVEKATYLIQRSITPAGTWMDLQTSTVGSTGLEEFEDTADALRWLKLQGEAGKLEDGIYRIIAIKREFPLKIEKAEVRKVSMG